MKKYLLVVVTLILISCNKQKYKTGHFKESVINFSEVNSIYDDYNSTAPFIYYHYLFHFSSNRNSEGIDFDIIGKNMFIEWNMTNGTLDIGTNSGDERFDYLAPMFDSINTTCNELGPYSMGFHQDNANTEANWIDLLMYANDCGGNYDIKFIYATTGESTAKINPVRTIDYLNSDADDLYPAFFGTGLHFFDEWAIEAANIEKILFCSNREGSFDLFSVNLPGGTTLINTLQSDLQYEINKLTINSEQDDKCPFANGNLLVFASNRTGGFGGYDLYYSKYENGNWTEPKNFGDKINSEYDEYRPISVRINDFDNNLLIFSSNRPGGKGGFDLYYVGIKQLIE